MMLSRRLTVCLTLLAFGCGDDEATVEEWLLESSKEYCRMEECLDWLDASRCPMSATERDGFIADFSAAESRGITFVGSCAAQHIETLRLFTCNEPWGVLPCCDITEGSRLEGETCGSDRFADCAEGLYCRPRGDKSICVTKCN